MAGFSVNAIEQAVKSHDKYQIEIKLDYELLQAKVTRYKVSTYIFAPRNLGLHRHNYSKEDFYRDVQNYIRLKTPDFHLRDFTGAASSPLNKIKVLASTGNWINDQETTQRIITNLKLLGAMLKSAIRDHFALIEQRVSEASPDSKVHLFIHNLIEEFLVESQKIAAQHRSYYALFNLPNVPEDVFTAYQFSDESLSILIEESAIDMFQIVGEYAKRTTRNDFKQRLNDLVKQETKHRRHHGYGSILSSESENETYIFRSSALKKYSASVLYLKAAVMQEGLGLEQVLYSIAAGIAMIFTVVVSFYAQRRYGNSSLPFFVALVVGYMFKDRIKEFGRTIFAKMLQDRLYDRRIVIRTQDKKHKLGILKEKVAFIREEDAPRLVLKARGRDRITSLANEGGTEQVICYTKEITLYTGQFKKAFPDFPHISGINDIIRYDIRPFLRKMGEPIQDRNYLRDEEIEVIPCHKVYHLNFVSRYRALEPKKMKLHRRIRVVLNQAGIKRVEHVEV